MTILRLFRIFRRILPMNAPFAKSPCQLKTQKFHLRIFPAGIHFTVHAYLPGSEGSRVAQTAEHRISHRINELIWPWTRSEKSANSKSKSWRHFRYQPTTSLRPRTAPLVEQLCNSRPRHLRSRSFYTSALHNTHRINPATIHEQRATESSTRRADEP